MLRSQRSERAHSAVVSLKLLGNVATKLFRNHLLLLGLIHGLLEGSSMVAVLFENRKLSSALVHSELRQLFSVHIFGDENLLASTFVHSEL